VFRDAIGDRGLRIYVFSPQTKDVVGRNKSGHDKI